MVKAGVIVPVPHHQLICPRHQDQQKYPPDISQGQAERSPPGSFGGIFRGWRAQRHFISLGDKDRKINERCRLFFSGFRVSSRHA